MGKLMSCCETEPALGSASEQAGIQYNCSSLYKDQLIPLFVHIVDGNVVIIEYGFSEDSAILADILKLQRQTHTFDDILNGNGFRFIAEDETGIVVLQRVPGYGFNQLRSDIFNFGHYLPS